MHIQAAQRVLFDILLPVRRSLLVVPSRQKAAKGSNTQKKVMTIPPDHGPQPLVLQPRTRNPMPVSGPNGP